MYSYEERIMAVELYFYRPFFIGSKNLDSTIRYSNPMPSVCKFVCLSLTLLSRPSLSQ